MSFLLLDRKPRLNRSFKFRIAAILLLLPLCSNAAAVQPGGSFVETSKSYRQGDYSSITKRKDLERKSFAWRGERVNWQLVLWAGEKPVQAKVTAGDLVSSQGHRIQAGQLRLDFLKFIAMNTRKGYAQDPSQIEYVPDMLNGAESVRIGPGHFQPLWVGVDIPRDAEPGVYRGNLSVELGTELLQFPFTIRVLPAVVPPVEDWSFDVNFWMHPQAAVHYYAGCRNHGQDPAKWEHRGCADLMWSDQHFEWYRPTLELLRDAGQKTITVNLVKNPWRVDYFKEGEQPQTNYPYDEMIHWRRKPDGSFSFDFTHFERFVRFCMELGIDQEIECFSMLPWISSPVSGVSCYDEASGREIIYHFKDWDDYEEVWTSFMEAFVPLLVKNGWFEKTRIGLDERELENIHHVLKVLSKFKHGGKTLRVSAACNKVHSFDDSVNYISMHGGTRALANDQWTEREYAGWASKRRAMGLTSTWYTCTGTYPGNFGNSRPAESLYIGWYTARLQADGYLRWAVDSWNDKPTESTDHKLFETGDTFQLYPGDKSAEVPFTRSSVRFELFRQGVVDYEKIRTLLENTPETRELIDAMLAKIVRPRVPARVEGGAAFRYEPSTEKDFSGILKNAERELLEITLEALKGASGMD